MDINDIPQALIGSERVAHLVFECDVASRQFRAKACPDPQVVVGGEHAEHTAKSRVPLGVDWVRLLTRLGDDPEDLFGGQIMDG